MVKERRIPIAAPRPRMGQGEEGVGGRERAPGEGAGGGGSGSYWGEGGRALGGTISETPQDSYNYTQTIYR